MELTDSQRYCIDGLYTLSSAINTLAEINADPFLGLTEKNQRKFNTALSQLCAVLSSDFSHLGDLLYGGSSYDPKNSPVPAATIDDED